MKHFLAIALAVLILAGYFLPLIGPWSGLWVVFFIHPILDNFLLKAKMTETSRPSPLAEKFYFFAVAVLVPISIGIGYLQYEQQTTLAGQIAIILSTGIIGGFIGINTAHELAHRRESLWQNIAQWNLLWVSFTHWGIEHVYGHHKNVATPEDPATSRMNEWIYTYWLRSYFNGLQDAWKIGNKNKLALWTGLQFLLYSALYWQIGAKALVFFLSQSLVAILLLQTVDYIEHYGLLRKKKEQNFYEGVKPHHSWDSELAFSNYSLLNLGLHSHHHAKASLPYHQLKPQTNPHQMPFGYSLMSLIALLPPLYFKIMNPRITPSP